MLNKNDLLLKLKQPIVIVSVCFALLWVVSDLSVRIVKSIPSKEDANAALLKQTAFKRNITSEEAAKLLVLYQNYKPIEEGIKTVEPAGLTKEEQLRQSGLLTEVFIENNKLTLKAIVQPLKNSKKVALIEVMNIKEQQHELKRFDDQTQVYGYTFEVLNNTQVKLTAQREQQTQEIILSMFKDIAPATKSQ